MASFSHDSFPSKHLSACKMMKIAFLLFLIVFLLLASSCSAARPGMTMMALESKNGKQPAASSADHHQQVYQTAFRYQGKTFNFLPKGDIPPSGPSKKHNSVEN